MGALEVRLLGPLEAAVDGRPVDLGGHKQRAVLAVLALARGAVVPVDRLIDAVWAGDPPARASNSLQVYISNLRKALEPERDRRTPSAVIVTQAPGYRLATDGVDVDLDRFVALIARGTAPDLDEALALWRGDPLGEFTYEPWAEPEIRRVEEVHATAVEDRIALLDAHEAIPRLEQLVTRDATRERLWGLLMLARWDTGQQTEALAAYQRARTALAEQMGVDPGPALRDLEARILAHDPELRWSGPTASPAAPATATAAAPPLAALRDLDAPSPPAPVEPFVGRDAEVARIVAAVERASAGRGGVVLVAGGAGAGKTRLTEEALRLLGARGADFTVGWGRTSEVRAAPPHGVWREAMGAAVDPSVSVFDGDAGTDHGGDTRAARARLFEAVIAELAGRGAEQTTVLVLDDLHWADESSLALLAAVADVAADLPLVVLGTYRDEEATAGTSLAATLTAVVRARGVERIELGGLDPAEVGRLTAALVGADIGADQATALTDRTGGNPFYVTELARAAAELGIGSPAGAPVPSSVRDVVRGRVARLPDSTRAVLDVAAVAGHGFSVDVVGAAAGLDGDEALDALDAALAAGVVRPGPGGTLRFSHALVADSVAEDLTAIRRARLHAKVAAALQERPSSSVDPAEIAHHLSEGVLAGTAEAAVEASAAAARAASRRLGHAEAVALWSQALTALDVAAPTDRSRRARLLVERGRAAARAGAIADQLASLHEAIDLAEELGDHELLIEAATAFGDATAWRWRDIYTVDARTVAALERSLARLGPAPTAARARVLSHLAVELDEVRADRKEELADEALEVARTVGDPDGLARTLRHGILARFTPQGAEDRVELAEELLALAEAAGDEETAAVARFSAMFSLLELARVPDADAILDRVTTDVERLRLTGLGFQLSWYHATRSVLAGDLATAQEHALRAADAQRRSGQFGAEPTFALHDLTAVRLGAAPHPDAAGHLPTPAAVALHDLALGAAPADVRRRTWGDGPPPRPGDPGDMFLVYATALEADLCLQLGEDRLVDWLWEVLSPWSGRLATAGSGAVCEGAVDHFLAMVCVLRGDRVGAERLLRAALALHERIPAPLHVERSVEALDELR